MYELYGHYAQGSAAASQPLEIRKELNVCKSESFLIAVLLFKMIVLVTRQGGDIGLFITLVPKVYNSVGLTTLGSSIEF